MRIPLNFLVFGGFGGMMSICDIGLSDWRYWVLLLLMFGAEFIGGLKND